MDLNINLAQGQRKLSQLTFVPSSTQRIEVPTDTVIREMQIVLSGSITTTFASGTPVADDRSTLDNLVSNIRLNVDGGSAIKSVRPYMQSRLQLLTSGVAPTRRSSAGASAASFNFPTADAGFTYGTTGQITTVREAISLYFSVPFARAEDRNATLLNTKGRSTVDLYFSTQSYAQLLGFGNTAPVVFSASTFVIDVTIKEDRSIPANKVLLDYVQYYQEYQHSAQASGIRQRVNVAQWLMGLAFLTSDGAAGSTTTATGKVLNSNVISNIELAANGSNIIQKTTFQELQDQNRRDFGIVTAFASNKSPFDGYAFLNLLQEGRLDSALDCRKGQPKGIDNLEIAYDLQAVSYTNPVTVGVETHEYRERV